MGSRFARESALKKFAESVAIALPELSELTPSSLTAQGEDSILAITGFWSIFAQGAPFWRRSIQTEWPARAAK
jgi:hypothetical protein